jgi:iron complex transport system substrate-binding protein
MRNGGSLRYPTMAALAAVLAVSVTACSQGDSGSPDGEIVVVDALGRTVTLPEVPGRIAVAGRAALMIFDAVYLFPGGSERLVAFEAGRESSEAFAALVDPNLSQKTLFERNVGPEEIAAANPDLVILKSYMAGDLGAPLEQLGVPVLYLDLETPEQYERDLAVLGTVLGEPERAEEIASFYRDRVARISAATAGLADDRRPEVLVLQYSASEGTTTFKVPPASWLQTTMVTLAGGTPVWAGEAFGDGWITVGFEQIAAWNPDQIYLISYAGDSAAVAESLQSDPAWQALEAVKSGSIYGWPGDHTSWDQPDSRWILGLTWLFTKLQPELAAGIDLMDEVEALFTELYRLTPAAVQAEVVPTLFGSLP